MDHSLWMGFEHVTCGVEVKYFENYEDSRTFKLPKSFKYEIIKSKQIQMLKIPYSYSKC